MHHNETQAHRHAVMARVWPAAACLVLAISALLTATGCAVVAGGAAGAATGYIAGHEAGEHSHHDHD